MAKVAVTKKKKKTLSEKLPGRKKTTSLKTKIKESTGKVKKTLSNTLAALKKKYPPRRKTSSLIKEKLTSREVNLKPYSLEEQPEKEQKFKENLELSKGILPSKYNDDRIVALSRDPFWIHTYWDLSEEKINQGIYSFPFSERESLRWVLRVYEAVGSNYNEMNFFDLDIYFPANNWYINTNKPDTPWQVAIGLKSKSGKFVALCFSNIVKTPPFGISSLEDERWRCIVEEILYPKGAINFAGSVGISQKWQQYLQEKVSSFASGGSLAAMPKRKEDYFLEVWADVIIYGRTKPGSEVKINKKKVALSSEGCFSSRYALGCGEVKFNIEANSLTNKNLKKEKTIHIKRKV